jgi:hypothetical protein
LSSINFTLLGVPFDRAEIDQGGEVVFDNGVIENLEASYQGVMPPGSPVENVTFGFGGPGVIGYIDLNQQYGEGAFTFGPTEYATPEPEILPMMGTGIALLLAISRSRFAAKLRRA